MAGRRVQLIRLIIRRIIWAQDTKVTILRVHFIFVDINDIDWRVWLLVGPKGIRLTSICLSHLCSHLLPCLSQLAPTLS